MKTRDLRLETPFPTAWLFVDYHYLVSRCSNTAVPISSALRDTYNSSLPCPTASLTASVASEAIDAAALPRLEAEAAAVA